MKKIFFLFSFLCSLSAFAVHDTTIVDRTCLIEFNWQSKTVEIPKSMCKVYLSGSLVYVYDNSTSDHMILNKTQTQYILDYHKVQTPVCPTADSLRKAILVILNNGCAAAGIGGGPYEPAFTCLQPNKGGTGICTAYGRGEVLMGYTAGTMYALPRGSLGRVLTISTVVGGDLPQWLDPLTINQSRSTFTVGSVPFQGSGGKLIEDNANFLYDSTSKTLFNSRQIIKGLSGRYPLGIFPTIAQGIYIESTSGGIMVRNTNSIVPGIVCQTDGIGVNVDSKDIAVQATSEKQAGVFTQSGEASAAIASSVVSVVRDVNNGNVDGNFDCTGPMLHLVNNIPYITSSTGPFIKASDAGVERFVIQNDGRGYLNTQTDTRLSISGGVEADYTTVGTVGSTPTDVFTKSIKASTLLNNGDEYFVRYYLSFNEATKTKSVLVYLGGTTIYNSAAFGMTSSTGSGTLTVSIIRTGTNAVTCNTTLIVTDGTSSITPLVVNTQMNTATPTLTNAATLRVSGACQAGSANNGVQGTVAKYFFNPKN